MNRRRFLRLGLGTSLLSSVRVAVSFPHHSILGSQSDLFAVQFRKPNPYEALSRHISPGHDEFVLEKPAFEITARLKELFQRRSFSLAEGFRGFSPAPSHYSRIAADVQKAVFESGDLDFQKGLQLWLASLGKIRESRFFVTDIRSEGPDTVRVEVRYEIASDSESELQYRVGRWNQVWKGSSLAFFEPLEEVRVTSSRPWFTEITEQLFGRLPSFREQMLKGVPYWRSCLDSATGIDVYGNNGIAMGDIDGDGWDEIYVCQPGGLPNRLYKNRGGAAMEDITDQAGVGVLDNTACALFLDLRNSGLQDLVVLCSTGPLLFLNQGSGRFRFKSGAFEFKRPPQGTFTGMSAADYDRDGRVDLYLCSYIYYQSEDQYRYSVPYHDATNGPPNFLFRNELNPDGSGSFRDTTHEAGLDQNNDRYSFAPAWCDYDGDGWPDLYVANDFGRNNLYKNEGGRFRDVAASAGVENIGPGMSTTWFDYNGDGHPDLYVTNMWTAAGQRLTRQQEFLPSVDEQVRGAYRDHARGNALYRNRGDGTFEEATLSQGVGMGRWSWSADAVDFDNDGWPEIYVTTGMITHPSETDLESFFWRQVVARSPAGQTRSPQYENGWNALNQLIREDYSWNGREPNVFYARRAGRYYDFSGVSGLDFADDSRTFAVTDLDGDGSPDLILKSRLEPQLRALRNDCGTNGRSIAVRLIGTQCNRDAIGAKVVVETQGTEGRRRICRFLQAGSGYLSQHSKTLYIGLGEERRVSKVRIEWPSGLRQEFSEWEAGHRYEIVEGSDQIPKIAFPGRRHHLPRSVPLKAENRPLPKATWFVEPVILPEPHKGPGFLCLTQGESVSRPAGLPFETIDLHREPVDLAGIYGLFRRYLFDWRTPLQTPVLFLIDEQGEVRKFYPEIPEVSVLTGDFRQLLECDLPECRLARALPFAGQYYFSPQRRYFQMGAAFYWAGYRKHAIPYLENALERSPSNFKILLSLGQIHLEIGQLASARDYLLRAQEVNSSSPELWNNLGGLEMAQENYVTALKYFEKSLAIEADLPYALVNAAQARVKLGQQEKAEELFRRALEIDPEDAHAANQFGLLLAAGNRLEEARELFQQAIAAQRDHAQAINNLGVVYARQDRREDAIAAFQYGIDVAPDYEDLYLNLARLYVRIGQRQRAREVMRRLLFHKPESVRALRALQELEER